MRLIPIAFAFAVTASAAAAQSSATMPPTNDAPNFYKTVDGFAKMPAGRTWGSTSAVDIDKDGVSIWVGERCGTNSCVGSTLDPVLKFDKDGNLVKSFGAGLIASPHGITLDKDGNVWVVDCSCTGGGGGGGRGGRGGAGAGAGAGAGGGRGGDSASVPLRTVPPPATTGHQIYKFDKDGKLLMTLGKAGGGRDAEYFTTPNAIAIAPNGDLYVAEGHSSVQGQSPARVIKFDKTGKWLATWGTVYDSTKKDEPYAFNQPHTLAFDSKGRLFVGDRGYNRIKLFDQSGKLLDTWYQFGRPSGVFIDSKDNIYVADSESGTVNPPHWAWIRGMRVGKISDGKVTAFIPDQSLACPGRLPAEAPASMTGVAGSCQPSTSSAEGVAVDKNGVIYGAEVGQKALKRHEKKP